VRAVLSWSYRSLGAEAAHLFRSLGHHPGPHISTAAAASLAGMSMADARSALADLTEAHLLGEVRPDRFTHAQLGEYERTLHYCRRALDILAEAGFPQAEADTWDSLAYSHQKLGQFDEAIAGYRNALGLFRESNDGRGEADTLVNLGDCQLATGDREAATDAWQQALVLFRALGRPDVEQVTRRLTDHAR